MSTNRYVTRTEFNALAGMVHEIHAVLVGDQPAKAVTPKAPKARKAPAKPAPKARRISAPTCGKTTTLTRASRPLFVKAHPWAQGLGTSTIAAMCVEEPGLLAKGWVIGPRNTARFS